VPDGRPGQSGTGFDLEIALGAPQSASQSPPEGTVLAEHVLSDEEWSRFVRRPDGGFVLRYFPVCDMLVDASLQRAVIHPLGDTSIERVSVFASGALPAFVLLMRGEPVLHASAVDVGGSVVAFVGQSGMGKSTMATLACAAGARLVTDDVLRLDPGVPPRCYLGGGELRLRRTGPALEELGVSGGRRTGDGRDAVTLSRSEAELSPLSSIVIPLLDRDTHGVELRTLDPVEAVLALLSFPRFVGWEEPSSHARQFQLLSDICEQVPVMTARVPWGPPFPADLISDLFAAAGVSPPGREA